VAGSVIIEEAPTQGGENGPCRDSGLLEPIYQGASHKFLMQLWIPIIWRTLCLVTWTSNNHRNFARFTCVDPELTLDNSGWGYDTENLFVTAFLSILGLKDAVRGLSNKTAKMKIRRRTNAR